MFNTASKSPPLSNRAKQIEVIYNYINLLHSSSIRHLFEKKAFNDEGELVNFDIVASWFISKMQCQSSVAVHSGLYMMKINAEDSYTNNQTSFTFDPSCFDNHCLYTGEKIVNDYQRRTIRNLLYMMNDKQLNQLVGYGMINEANEILDENNCIRWFIATVETYQVEINEKITILMIPDLCSRTGNGAQFTFDHNQFYSSTDQYKASSILPSQFTAISETSPI